MSWIPGCTVVLAEVFHERERQEARYGHINDHLLSGTGPDATWLLPYSTDGATQVEDIFRQDYETLDLPTWIYLLREELAEVAKEPPGSLELDTELIQLAALCVSWVERNRNARQTG